MFPEVGISMQEAGGQCCPIWDPVSVKMSPKQSVALEQYPQWEPLFSHLRFFLPGLKNNGDKCIQRSREQTMLGKPENAAARPRASVTAERSDNNKKFEAI